MRASPTDIDTTRPPDASSTRRAWARARARYPADAHMPVPLWASRGLPDGPARTWAALTRELAGGGARDRRACAAMSVYVHIPFCETRCPFCDCHAALLPRERDAASDMTGRYLEALLGEIEAWTGLPGIGDRRVTTVHFGGGTPLAIGPEALGKVVTSLRDALAVDTGTEWAIETTARSLDHDGIEGLVQLGFTRIHVGVQSLQGEDRRILGRRGTADMVLDRIAACVAHGWVTSADLLYGLPGQSASNLCADIARLVAAGIDGVSLYHLNHGMRNRGFMKRLGLDARDDARLFEDFALFAEASALLETLGYSKNHVTHFAGERDANLYSRHALRGEDLLGLGSSSDGVFGNRFYRHGELDGYLAAPAAPRSASSLSPLTGSGAYAAGEQRARPLVAALMASEVHTTGLEPEALGFVQGLERDGFLEAHGCSGDGLRLTAAGSWFAGAVTAEAWRLFAPAGG